MFYLRIVTSGQVQNYCLGKSYRKVTSDFKCEEAWIRIPREENPRCSMFIFPESGDAIPIFLWDYNNDYYIVTEGGRTYEKLV